jgi:hypothetical protein
MLNVLALIALPLLAAPSGAVPTACSIDVCDDDPPAVEIPYDYDVDADVFAVHMVSEDLCIEARAQLADGIPENDIIDVGVDVLTDSGLVATPEGVFYLRGVLRGCLV